MSAIHREWAEQQAARFNGASKLPTAGQAITGREPARRYPRSADEAFKTVAWRAPVQGPYRRPPSGWRGPVLVAAAVLLVVGVPLALSWVAGGVA